MDIIFCYGNKTYRVNASGCQEKKLIVLPNRSRTVLEVPCWSNTNQPEAFNEVPHIFHDMTAAQIAAEMKGVVAEEVSA